MSLCSRDQHNERLLYVNPRKRKSRNAGGRGGFPEATSAIAINLMMLPADHPQGLQDYELQMARSALNYAVDHNEAFPIRAVHRAQK